jgi:hypothetical protein
MSRLLFAVAITLGGVLSSTDRARASTNVASHFDRRISKEPRYEGTPKYSLITAGDGGDVKVWMVEDGKRLFVDKNANGNMTDRQAHDARVRQRWIPIVNRMLPGQAPFKT